LIEKDKNGNIIKEYNKETEAQYTVILLIEGTKDGKVGHADLIDKNGNKIPVEPTGENNCAIDAMSRAIGIYSRELRLDADNLWRNSDDSLRVGSNKASNKIYIPNIKKGKQSGESLHDFCEKPAIIKNQINYLSSVLLDEKSS
jgi:hypothetical protein